MKFIIRNKKGFTLVELMITVVIVGVLVAVAVPSFIVYRYKAKIAAAVATADSIRASFGGYAASHTDYHFPATSEIASWNDLKTMCNRNGSSLKDTEEQQGLIFSLYYDMDDQDEYYLILLVQGVPVDLTGSKIEVRASGILIETL
jgi:prepilin-type N-terminal cleavage/methylation domain-containing protein